jgi:hypothetical protein
MVVGSQCRAPARSNIVVVVVVVVVVAFRVAHSDFGQKAHPV